MAIIELPPSLKKLAFTETEFRLSTLAKASAISFSRRFRGATYSSCCTGSGSARTSSLPLIVSGKSSMCIYMLGTI